jgi:DNA polymerase III subunit beta
MRRSRCEREGPIAFFECRGVTIAHRVVEATFPPYEQVIPARGSMGRHHTIAREALVSALRAVSTAASDRTGGVKLTFRADSLDVHAEDPDEGSADERLDAARVTGPEGVFTQGVNARYLIEACEALDASHVMISTSGELDPIVVTVGGEEDTTAVVMPMRI